ncbi:short-chain dehydrogenase reductase ATA1 [Trifolium pratense]|uniref:short-chain dehydrogenase reductase ATA1 n=1 Tax=Trifolium pratense TaxID=57577 RepID=UPI001E68FE9A|nr:short-chain dehydrogenase reductase ATA1 [Trifolium pratense]
MESHMIQNVEAKNSVPKRLVGKVAVITGGARGIGAATAKLFAENGAHVIIADVLDEEGTKVAELIDGLYIHCDVSKESDIESAINLSMSWKGHLDIMFNNAGISGSEGMSITTLDMEKLTQILSVNLFGTIHGIKHAAKAMIKGKRGGSIICTSSAAATIGGYAAHGYTMSKSAMNGLMRSAACELGVHLIRVNCISPHGVPSEMLLNAFRTFDLDMTSEELNEYIGKNASLLKGRGSTLEDVAQAALFLASDESGFITAHNLPVDGGITNANCTMSFIYQDYK